MNAEREPAAYLAVNFSARPSTNSRPARSVRPITSIMAAKSC
jgi:hypothetical protein